MRLKKTGLEEIKLDINNFKPLRNYFESLQKWMPSTKKEVLNKIGGVVDHCFRWGSSQWDMPTLETYNDLINHFSINKFDSFREYEDLRREYEDLRRPYYPIEDYKTEILKFSQEGHKTGKYNHDTVKPELLSRYLVRTCSRKEDLVFVPFAGSGTECAMSKKEGRNFIGYDIEKKYVDMANQRCYFEQPTLF